MKKMTIGSKIKLDPAQKEAYQQIFQEITFAKKNQKCIAFCCDSQDISSRLLPLQMAAAVADESQRIAVVNAGAQSPAIEQDAENQGLTNYLSGRCELADVIFETDLPNVDLIPVGRAIMNPMLLMEDEVLQSVFSQCAKQYDWVLVNTAPLSSGNVSAVKLAQFCDGVVLLSKDHTTNKAWLKAAKETFEKIGCSVEGCIVVDAKKSKSYQ